MCLGRGYVYVGIKTVVETMRVGCLLGWLCGVRA